eukprot:TRINITY_DN430_c0_g2_i4.p2 TRINITY_DN430_c0_g2~~TRINITY_DN430_c0_g2_i4.p2  ORF type:complete len:354 (+),score=14.37 TRINITY_DN430_c0_g2_i4:156-1064(+)
MLQNSDIIVFHNYGDLHNFKSVYESLLQYNRPIMCNEYMARTEGSTFQAIMPFMKEYKIGAYNWGFVAGKTQTIYPWNSWEKKYKEEPKVWFHDILRQDGTPFDQAEVELIKSLTHQYVFAQVYYNISVVQSMRMETGEDKRRFHIKVREIRTRVNNYQKRLINLIDKKAKPMPITYKQYSEKNVRVKKVELEKQRSTLHSRDTDIRSNNKYLQRSSEYPLKTIQTRKEDNKAPPRITLTTYEPPSARSKSVNKLAQPTIKPICNLVQNKPKMYRKVGLRSNILKTVRPCAMNRIMVKYIAQ